MHRALFALLLAGCGGSPAPASLPPAGDQVADIEGLGAEIDRIEQRAGQIPARSCSRHELALPAPGCDDAEAVCRRSRRICERAGELGDNPWAAERCRDARERCEDRRCHCLRAVAAPWD
jgi:hypothetical protein